MTTNLFTTPEAQTLNALMEGIIDGNYDYGTTIEADVMIYIEKAELGFKFMLIAGLEAVHHA